MAQRGSPSDSRSAVFVFIERKSADDFMGVGRVAFAHLRDGVREQPLAYEDVGVFGEETEDEPRHEVVHVVATFRRAPLGIVLQEFEIKPVQTAGRLNVERVLRNLPDGRDTGQRQKKAEVIGKVRISAGDGLAARQLLGIKIYTVGCENVLCLRFGGCRTILQRGQRFGDLPSVADRDMNIVGLEDAAEIGLIGSPGAEPLKSRLLVAEGLQECIREVRSVKWLLRKLRDGFFDFNSVQRGEPSSDVL